MQEEVFLHPALVYLLLLCQSLTWIHLTPLLTVLSQVHLLMILKTLTLQSSSIMPSSFLVYIHCCLFISRSVPAFVSASDQVAATSDHQVSTTNSWVTMSSCQVTTSFILMIGCTMLSSFLVHSYCCLFTPFPFPLLSPPATMEEDTAPTRCPLPTTGRSHITAKL